MSPVLMLDTYNAHTIRITRALAYFGNGGPAPTALPIWTVSVDDELLSCRRWEEAGLPEGHFLAATEGDEVTLQGLLALARRYVDAPGPERLRSETR